MESKRTFQDSRSFCYQRCVFAYFLLTFTISWSGAALVALPALVRGHAVSKMTGIIMFPAMLLGPSVAGILMTRLVDGKAGLKGLFRRMGAVRVGGRWYAVLFVPPLLVLATLSAMSRLLSPSFTPNHFYIGMLFGIPAGVFEEIGWTGLSFPKMQS